MISRANIAVLALSILLPGCDGEPTKTTALPETETPPPLTGWKSLKLGMSFDEALAAVPHIAWNPYSAQECTEVMATDGCFLSANEGEAFVPEEGIALSPNLSFNKFGKLTDIGLQYEQDRRVTQSDCIELHERTLDRLTREVGKLRSPDVTKDDEKQEPGWRRETRQTPEKNSYRASLKGRSFFVTTPMRSHFGGVKFPTSKPIPDWNDQAYVSLMTTFLVYDATSNCSVSIGYHSGPQVLRRKMEK